MAIRRSTGRALLLAVEVLFIWTPLLFHSAYGFLRVGQAELENPLRNDYLGAYLYTLQRVSGVLAFGHIGFTMIGAYATAWFTLPPLKKSMALQLPALLPSHFKLAALAVTVTS